MLPGEAAKYTKFSLPLPVYDAGWPESTQVRWWAAWDALPQSQRDRCRFIGPADGALVDCDTYFEQVGDIAGAAAQAWLESHPLDLEGID